MSNYSNIAHGIHNMGLIESIVWIMTGFIPTLTTMEIAWRIANIRVREEVAMANNTVRK
ncbi:MAG: hypothetical protein FIO03_00600 [Nitrosopumilales archaeon]|nr:hypothetical protein [Nitrosopumilales archaeon]